MEDKKFQIFVFDQKEDMVETLEEMNIDQHDSIVFTENGLNSEN